MLEENYCDIKGDFFNLKKLHHLRMVHSHRFLRTNTHYWIVYSPHGLALSNWKTKIRIIEILETANKEIYVLAECTIMDGNYSFRQYYDFSEYTFFEYE